MALVLWFSTPLTISTIYWVPGIFVAVTSPSGGGMVSDGLGVGTLDLSKIVSYPPVLLEYTDKRCSPVNRIRCPTIALHTCIAFKKLSLAPVVLNSYNQQLGSGINHK